MKLGIGKGTLVGLIQLLNLEPIEGDLGRKLFLERLSFCWRPSRRHRMSQLVEQLRYLFFTRSATPGIRQISSELVFIFLNDLGLISRRAPTAGAIRISRHSRKRHVGTGGRMQ